jgi:hypothetical protein
MPYRGPEALFNLQWSNEVDIWSWGMVVCICLLQIALTHANYIYEVSVHDPGIPAP